ncbi:hypothetical protein SNE40_010763 [Patella caerulea]|uniref:Uncharacterized protein n=1 Tax=Patella caerulea TaxID=87958 RepID=A0AAN8JVR0_PATCE
MNIAKEDTAAELLPNCAHSTPLLDTALQDKPPMKTTQEDTATELLSNSIPWIETTDQHNLAVRQGLSVVYQNILDGENIGHDDIALNVNNIQDQNAQGQTVTEHSEDCSEESADIWLKSTFQE